MFNELFAHIKKHRKSVCVVRCWLLFIFHHSAPYNFDLEMSDKHKITELTGKKWSLRRRHLVPAGAHFTFRIQYSLRVIGVASQGRNRCGIDMEPSCQRCLPLGYNICHKPYWIVCTSWDEVTPHLRITFPKSGSSFRNRSPIFFKQNFTKKIPFKSKQRKLLDTLSKEFGSENHY